MTPIEAMAKEFWNFQGMTEWDEAENWQKRPAIAGMRAALLALAECDLPSEIFDEAMHSETDSRSSIKLEKRFKFLLRSIANEHEVSGQLTSSRYALFKQTTEQGNEVGTD